MMKAETKKMIEKGVLLFSPLFTIIMYLLPWMGYYKEDSTITSEYGSLHSFFELLKFDVTTFTTIIMWLSLVGVTLSFVFYILSLIFLNKEKLFIKIAAITLVTSTCILIFSPLLKEKKEILAGVINYRWIDFMFFPYALLLIYNVGSLIYIFKNEKRK